MDNISKQHLQSETNIDDTVIVLLHSCSACHHSKCISVAGLKVKAYLYMASSGEQVLHSIELQQSCDK